MRDWLQELIKTLCHWVALFQMPHHLLKKTKTENRKVWKQDIDLGLMFIHLFERLRIIWLEFGLTDWQLKRAFIVMVSCEGVVWQRRQTESCCTCHSRSYPLAGLCWKIPYKSKSNRKFKLTTRNSKVSPIRATPLPTLWPCSWAGW